jgi:hypothetical protein
VAIKFYPFFNGRDKDVEFHWLNVFIYAKRPQSCFHILYLIVLLFLYQRFHILCDIFLAWHIWTYFYMYNNEYIYVSICISTILIIFFCYLSIFYLSIYLSYLLTFSFPMSKYCTFLLLFLFFFFPPCCVAQVGLELTLWHRVALNYWSYCLNLPNSRIIRCVPIYSTPPLFFYGKSSCYRLFSYLRHYTFYYYDGI